MKNFGFDIASGTTICYNSLASDFCHFKTGGRVAAVHRPITERGLVTALGNLQQPLILGGCTNSLISDNGLDNDVILTSGVADIAVEGRHITAFCGAPLSKVCLAAKRGNLSGMEQLCGIPGSVGGAVAMNAGAFGRAIADVVVSVTAYCNGELVVLKNDECDFAYRSSCFSSGDFCVISATFRLDEGEQNTIGQNMQKYRQLRRQSQPGGISLGSVFKRCGGTGAGYYIEKCGLKGATYGGCMVSEKHANFIMNTGTATSSDFAMLARMCQDAVYEQFGIILQREVKYFGEFA